jgi:small neutral amino acid transporter SnatA (MarC family)
VTVVAPAATDVAKPCEPEALLIVATPALDELQVTAAVSICVVLSENVPMAVNCWVVPLAMPGLVGVIATDTSIAGFTVRVVDPDMLPDVAVTVVAPAATDVAKPCEPEALLIVATPALDELQVTAAVSICVVSSENVPMAVNCWVVPLAMPGLVGVTVMDTSVALVTVRSVEPEMPPNLPLMVVLPAFFPYAYACPLPICGAAVMSGDVNTSLLIVATLVSDELHVTNAVRSLVVLSE